MKAIVVSDTHKERKAIEKIVEFAKANDISTVFDAGDLHGEIDAYQGIENLHAVYWSRASGAMDSWSFNSGVQAVGGTVHQNGSAFKLEDMLVYMQHNLADYEDEIPQDSLDAANRALDSLAEGSEEELKRFIFFGHTHKPHYNDDGRAVAINPGSAGHNSTFAVLDSDEGSVEYRTLEGEVLLKIGKDSDIVHFRNLECGNYIAGLKNGNEVFVAKGERSEEFKKIKSGDNYVKEDYAFLIVQHEDGMQQLIAPFMHSRKYKVIKQYFAERNDDDKVTGKVNGYHAVKEVDGVDKHVLVVGEKEIESPALDKIDKYGGISFKEGMFVVKAGVGKEDDRDSKQFVLTMDLEGNVQQGKHYESVDRPEFIDGKLAYTVKEDGKMFVVVDGEEQSKYDAKTYSDRISNVKFIGGKLAYVIQGAGSERLFYDDEESEPVKKDRSDWDAGIKAVQEVDGKLAYIAKSSGDNAKVIVDSQVVLEGESIANFASVAGQIVYQKQSYGDCFMQDGSKIDGYKSPFQVNKDFEEGKLQLPGLE